MRGGQSRVSILVSRINVLCRTSELPSGCGPGDLLDNYDPEPYFSKYLLVAFRCLLVASFIFSSYFCG